jgi:para-nitrobenzyl esterase
MKAKINLTRVFFTFLLSGFLSFTSYTQTVKVEGGLVEGTVENGITVFKGIPFASPPVGGLRWRPPQPVNNWDGVIKADRFCPACPQFNIPMLGFVNAGISEDCLYLNIWKPDDTSEVKLPVMVWIYGGGFFIGSTSQALTGGEQLAKKGVIVVSIAYRIGALGFLSHPDLTAESENNASGNYGLLDQIAALKWVQNNIEAFGGDPGNVTIFGESAGGQSVSMLAASPLAKGLFHRAICMSGGSFGPARIKKEPGCMQLLKGAEKAGIEFAQRMGANSLNELRQIDPQKFLSDTTATIGGFWPIIDGYVITDDQYKLYEAGTYTDIPVLIGSTSDEGTLFIMTSKPGEYVETTRERFGPVADKILNLYPDSTDIITRKSMADLFRDSYFGWQTYIWATLQTKTGKSPVFVYYFDQSQPASALTVLLKSSGAYHGSDCAYAFNHLDQDPKIKYTDEDRRLSEIMVNYWTNFVKYGDPNGQGLPEWPAYVDGKPTVMYLKSDLQTGSFPNIDKIEIINEYYTWKRTTDDIE